MGLSKLPRMSGPSAQRQRDTKASFIVSATLSAPVFEEACAMAGIKPSRRQARKWNRKTGLAWAARPKLQ